MINAPSPRSGHTAVWTGMEMIVWGGTNDPPYSQNPLNTGGRYDPDKDNWAPTNISNAPLARSDNSAVWTGTEMIVWGGRDSANTLLNTGGRYYPAIDNWKMTKSSKWAFAAGWSHRNLDRIRNDRVGRL